MPFLSTSSACCGLPAVATAWNLVFLFVVEETSGRLCLRVSDNQPSVFGVVNVFRLQTYLSCQRYTCREVVSRCVAKDHRAHRWRITRHHVGITRANGRRRRLAASGPSVGWRCARPAADPRRPLTVRSCVPQLGREAAGFGSMDLPTTGSAPKRLKVRQTVQTEAATGRSSWSPDRQTPPFNFLIGSLFVASARWS